MHNNKMLKKRHIKRTNKHFKKVKKTKRMKKSKTKKCTERVV